MSQNRCQYYAVALLGARMHYAVPRILAQAGQLERFFTDLSAAHGWPRLLSLVPGALRPGGLCRLLSRVVAGVPTAQVTAFNIFGWRYARRRVRASNDSAMMQTFLWANQRFGELVCGADWGRASAVFTFNCAGLEVLRRAKVEGLRTVMEQTIAPSALEQRLLQEEHQLHPGWEPPREGDLPARYQQREQSEWPLADLILCGSDFVRDGIQQCGGPVEKCAVVPYGVNADTRALDPGGPGEVKTRCAHHSPGIGQPSPLSIGSSSLPRSLRVLTVGAVGLRKGAPYLLEAAKRLKGKAEFRWVGTVHLLPKAAARMAELVELTGTVPRPLLAAHYRWADVFVLPSLCEGSATATYEALAHGLPVICTPNCGSVVRHGVDGFITSVRDVGGLATCLQQLRQDAALRRGMSVHARTRAAEFNVAAYGQRLLAALESKWRS